MKENTSKHMICNQPHTFYKLGGQDLSLLQLPLHRYRLKYDQERLTYQQLHSLETNAYLQLLFRSQSQQYRGEHSLILSTRCE